jgi:molybdopterin molybdotransferase
MTAPAITGSNAVMTTIADYSEILYFHCMVLVEEAEKIILKHCKDFGTESVPLNESLGRVLAEDILADRDLPPFDRVTMDGIAIRYEGFHQGIRQFRIKATQAAGEPPVDITSGDECIEIMTGAVLPSSADTIVPYEDIDIADGIATMTSDDIGAHQNIHHRGKDKKQHELLVAAKTFITPDLVTVASAVGMNSLLVKKNPRVIIISTGDELVDIEDVPKMFQVRRSNNYALHAALKRYCVSADMLHLPDAAEIIQARLQQCVQDYDVILLSGGVSMGKFDFVPEALEKLLVKKLFYKVRQRPGKPFWFGEYTNGALVFAFPGNPVSTFLCFHRYFLRWLKASWGITHRPSYAILNTDFTFRAPLQYFLQVKLDNDPKGQLLATPIEGHGSGDFVNLLATDAFLELPMGREEFKRGEVFPAWIFKQMI